MNPDPPSPPYTAPARRDRLVLALGLVLVSALAWLATVEQARRMTNMDAAGVATAGQAWTPLEIGLIFAMWTIMMAAMMLPASFPMVAAFANINHRRRQRDAPYVATAVFVCGYLVAWTGYCALATSVQWGLQSRGLLSPMMEATSPALTAALFLLAGLYQLSPLKDACLARCRSPAGFILAYWRDGVPGAVLMGLRHGAYCIGCCAGLMLLLFAVAVMDLRWVVALAVLVTAEKLLPRPELWRRAIAVVLVLIGLALGASLVLQG